MRQATVSRATAVRFRAVLSALLRITLPAAILVAVAVSPAPVLAQLQGDGFLFQPPEGSITFHGGIARPRASSDVFTDTRALLTLDKEDFNSLSFGVEYAFQLSPRFDVFGGMGYSGSSERSEFRDWVDENELPIEQTTRFTRIPLSVGARMYVLPRGRTIGQHVWLPAAFAPYISAGAGVVWYSFKQTGDFVDFQDNEIITDNLESAGFAPLLHAGGGIEVSLTPRLALVADARYSLANASMANDFNGYDKIDLSGFAATAGLRIRF